MLFRSTKHASLVRRRIITGLALVAYVAGVTGYPVPLPSGEQDTSVAYPCQGHACGCLSADQCWDNCCCFSPAERLAWVRAHGVAIPAATLAALESAAGKSSPTAGCCQPRTQVASHGCGSCPGEKSDEADCNSCTTKTRHAAQSTESRGRVGWVSGIQAQKCQGLTTLWLVSGANLPVEIPTLWQFDWVLAGKVCPLAAHFDSHLSDPAVPPPRA